MKADAVVNQIVPRIVDNIVMPILAVLFALTTLYFVYGLFIFFTHGEDPESRKTGQTHILWGVVGIAIMVSVYGIVRFVASSVGQPTPF